MKRITSTTTTVFGHQQNQPAAAELSSPYTPQGGAENYGKFPPSQSSAVSSSASYFDDSGLGTSWLSTNSSQQSFHSLCSPAAANTSSSSGYATTAHHTPAYSSRQLQPISYACTATPQSSSSACSSQEVLVAPAERFSPFPAGTSTPHRVVAKPLALTNPHGSQDFCFSGASLPGQLSGRAHGPLIQFGSPESAGLTKENYHCSSGKSSSGKFRKTGSQFTTNRPHHQFPTPITPDRGPGSLNSSTGGSSMAASVRRRLNNFPTAVDSSGPGSGGPSPLSKFLALGQLPRTPTPFKKAMAAVQRRRGHIEPKSLLVGVENDSTPNQLVEDIHQIVMQDRTDQGREEQEHKPDFSLTPSKLAPTDGLSFEQSSIFGEMPSFGCSSMHSNPVLSQLNRQPATAVNSQQQPAVMSPEWLAVVCGRSVAQQRLTSLSRSFKRRRPRLLKPLKKNS